MRAVIQRVASAAVSVDGVERGRIGRGLLVFLGVGKGDDETDVRWLAAKVAKLRVFEDESGRMNCDVTQIADGGVLLISQFTLFGSLEKGSRPSFNDAEQPQRARALYEAFGKELETLIARPVPTGVFAAHMRIAADNDGPVTLCVDSRQKKL